MTRRLVIVGAGGFGREVFGIVQALREAGTFWELEGFVDDAPSSDDIDRVGALGAQMLGSVAELAERTTKCAVVIAVGSPIARRAIATMLQSSSVLYPALIHPAATLGPHVRTAEGVVIAAGARLSTNITLGSHVQIDQNATVGHDTVIGDYSRLNPQACVSGSVQIAEGVVVGASATVLQGLNIGAGATLGAGCVAVKNVLVNTTVKGVPAK